MGYILAFLALGQTHFVSLLGSKVEGVLVSDKPFLAIGTGDDLLRAVKRCLAQVE